MKDFGNLIGLIPVNDQSAVIKQDVWGRLLNDPAIKEEIFGRNDEIELSRADVRSEPDTAKKIVKVLMWGYPTGGRGSNIESTLGKIDVLIPLLSSVNEQNLTKAKASNTIADFASIRGLGISTWSKLLYFFEVAIDSKRCQIFDRKIVDSLNKKQFTEIGDLNWKQNTDQYYQYIEFVDDLAKSMGVLPEQVELFLFYYNLNYKFLENVE